MAAENGNTKPWKSKKFLAYTQTIPLLIAAFIAQVYWNAHLIELGHDAVVSEKLLELQLYIIGILCITYVGGEATLEAILGWLRRDPPKSKGQTVERVREVYVDREADGVPRVQADPSRIRR